MADDRLIDAYLRELRLSVRRLPDAEDILDEAEDHLREAAEVLEAQGRTAHEAEAEAVARFGSAELVARLCVRESKRGAAVPTTRTRWAGLALGLAPAMVVVGAIGNDRFDVHDQSGLHGLALFLLVLGFPALVAGLWGLQVRHGGLGRPGRAALVFTLLSPPLSLVGGYGAIVVLAGLLALAVGVFGIAMLHASVLPVPPLVLVIAGPALVLAVAVMALGVTLAGGDAGALLPLSYLPLAVTMVGLSWLGFHLWSEGAVDVAGRPRLAVS